MPVFYRLPNARISTVCALLLRKVLRYGLVILIGIVLCSGVATTQAADPPPAASDRLPSQSEVVTTSSGVVIHFTYFPSKEGKNAPVVMLLHMKDGNRFVWQGGFPERLQDEGFAVVAIDLRGHGESKPGGAGGAPAGGNANQPDEKKKGAPRRGTTAGPKLRPADYKAMTEDLDAVKKFLMKEHQGMRLNIARLGIVGPEMGATIAAVFADKDWNERPYDDGPIDNRTPKGQDVKAIVLVSPQKSFEGINTVAPLHDLRNPEWNVAFLVCVGKSDPVDKGQADQIFKNLKGTKSDQRMYFYSYPAKLRGTDLLGKGLPFEDHMMAFFLRHLKKPEIPWQDRRPKWDREKKP